MSEIHYRLLKSSDGEAMERLQHRCFPPPFPQEDLWHAEDAATHVQNFPDCQFVAEAEGSVVGTCSNMILPRPAIETATDWYALIGGRSMPNHNPNGDILFGVDISVDPDYRRLGIGKQFYQLRFDFVMEHKLSSYVTACRIPDLAKHPNLSEVEYVDAVLKGELSDRTLTPFLKIGLRFINLRKDFMPDPESRNFSCLLEWKP